MTEKSKIVAIVNDIHFDLHHVPTWNAFKAWAKKTHPDIVVFLGDFLDLGMLSRYPQHAKAPVSAIAQVRCFVKEANEVRSFTDRVVCIEGNHDERWEKALLTEKAQALDGAIGLELSDQCYAWGLDESVEWVKEDMVNKGLRLGPYTLRHGHKQAGRFGGGKHLAANRLMKNLGQNEIIGHHHKVQMFCQSALGRTSVGLVSGHMADDMDYTTDPDWQRGFTILELYGPDNSCATPHPILIQDGKFAWNGEVFAGGN